LPNIFPPPPPSSTRSAATTARSAAGIAALEDFVAVHDLLDFLVSATAERGRQECQGGGPLRGVHILEADAAATDESGGKVGPASPLPLVVEGVEDALALRLVERGEEGICGFDDTRSGGLRDGGCYG